MLPILHIGPLAIQFPGLVLLLGIWLGLSLAEKHINSHIQRYHSTENSHGFKIEDTKITAPVLYNLAVGSLLAAVIGARLFYVVQYTQAFIDNPVSLISLNTSLLDVRGAFLGAILFALYYGQRKHLQLWHTLDALTPALALVAIAFHLSNLASGAGFGASTQAPWAINLWGDSRHPVQLYEALFASIILFLLWPSQTKFKLNKPGEYFLYFLALSSASRLFFETYHGDSIIILGGIRSAQIIAWLILAISFYFLHRLSKPEKEKTDTQ